MTRSTTWQAARLPLSFVLLAGVAGATLWIPAAAAPAVPDFPRGGHDGAPLFVLSAAVELGSIVAGLVFVGVMADWDDVRLRSAARVWGWLAFVCSLPVALIFAVTLRFSSVGFLFPPTDLLAPLAPIVLFLIPALVPPRRSRLLVGLAAALCAVVYLLALDVTVVAIVPLLTGPFTAYAVALILQATAASLAASLTADSSAVRLTPRRR